MHKYIFLVLFTLAFFNGNGQNLTYKSCGAVYDSNNQRLSTKQVGELFKVDSNILKEYKKGREKKTIGNILLYGGLGLMAVDLFNGAVNTSATNSKPYPSALTFIGGAAFVASIPVKIGFSKKIRKSVEDYNKLNPVSYREASKRELGLIAVPTDLEYNLH